MDGGSRGRAIHFRRLSTNLPYLMALACGAMAVMEAALAARHSAPFPVSVSSGLMLSALLLAHDGNRWRVALVGLASAFAGFAGGGVALPAAASGAAVEVIVALVIRAILGRTGQSDLDFASLGSFARFVLIVALVHFGLEAPLRLALLRATGGDLSYDYFIQQSVAEALGSLIIAPWLTPALFRMRTENYASFAKSAGYWITIALASLFIFVVFKGTLTPLLPTLAVITFIGLRLGVPAAALCIMIAVAIASEYFAFRYDPGEGSALDPLSRNLKIQQFAAICLVIVMPVAATLAEKARLSAQLAASQHELETVLQSTGHVAFRTDPRGNFTYLSRAWEGLMGTPIASAIGQPAVNFMIPSDRSRSTARLALVAANELNSGREFRSIVRPDGQILEMEVTFQSLRDEDGSFAGIDGAMRDITKLRKVEEELERTRSELIHASRLSAMGALTSTIAHELNQPLAAVANFARGLRRMLGSQSPPLPPIVGDTLDDIDAGVLRAADIVRRMRSLVEKSPMRRQVHSLADIIDDARAIGLIDAASRGIECRVDIAEDADAVLVDEIQIQQVIVNLLRNAVDAMDGTAQPQIVIRALSEGDWAEVHVSDKGGGIGKESLANLFKPFDSTKQGGMGVGLSICRTIIEAHGGKIWGENLPSGACFKFTLPRASIPIYS